MTHEIDPLKTLHCCVSFDPAIDRVAMGGGGIVGDTFVPQNPLGDFVKHFGAVGGHDDQRLGSRDPALLKFVPGKRASIFVLRPLRAMERVACDSLPTVEGRWLRALSYALVRAEVCPPLASEAEAVLAPAHAQPFDDVAIDHLAERVGVEALYEIGAVAYTRSRLGFFGVGYAPLPPTSALVHVQQLRSLVDSLARTASATQTSDAASTSPPTSPTAPPTPGALGDVTAPEQPPAA